MSSWPPQADTTNIEELEMTDVLPSPSSPQFSQPFSSPSDSTAPLNHRTPPRQMPIIEEIDDTDEDDEDGDRFMFDLSNAPISSKYRVSEASETSADDRATTASAGEPPSDGRLMLHPIFGVHSSQGNRQCKEKEDESLSTEFRRNRLFKELFGAMSSAGPHDFLSNNNIGNSDDVDRSRSICKYVHPLYCLPLKEDNGSSPWRVPPVIFEEVQDSDEEPDTSTASTTHAHLEDISSSTFSASSAAKPRSLLKRKLQTQEIVDLDAGTRSQMVGIGDFQKSDHNCAPEMEDSTDEDQVVAQVAAQIQALPLPSRKRRKLNTATPNNSSTPPMYFYQHVLPPGLGMPHQSFSPQQSFFPPQQTFPSQSHPSRIPFFAQQHTSSSWG